MKNRYVATLLAVFFGWIGFHKFYLGRYIQGTLSLLFFWTFIPFAISLLEALLYACNGDKWFDITFNAEYMRNRDYIASMK